jgi:hypothetical protein
MLVSFLGRFHVQGWDWRNLIGAGIMITLQRYGMTQRDLVQGNAAAGHRRRKFWPLNENLFDDGSYPLNVAGQHDDLIEFLSEALRALFHGRNMGVSWGQVFPFQESPPFCPKLTYPEKAE